MANHELRITAIERALEKIADSMAMLARLEERHTETREALSRAFKETGEARRDTADIRLAIESLKGQIAPLQESRRWMIAGMLGVVSLVGVAVIGLVLIGGQ